MFIINLSEKDSLVRQRRRKIFRCTAIIGLIVLVICLLLMILADDFSVELLPLLLFCVIIVVITSWNGK